MARSSAGRRGNGWKVQSLEPQLPKSKLTCLLVQTCLGQTVSSTGIEHVVNRVVYYATGTEIYISAG
jgi:hypothetical protein